MIRLAVPAVLAGLALGGGCAATSAPSFDGELALRHVEHMVAAGPRVPNSQAHRDTGDWLVAELSGLADDVSVQAWSHVTAAGTTLELRNIVARFRPDAPERVLYVSHWDSRPTADEDPDPARRAEPTPGANDGGSSTAMLLALAGALATSPPPVGVDLLFTDGEDYGSFGSPEAPDVLIGSKHFAANLPAGYQIQLGVVWDMIGGFDQRFTKEYLSVLRAPRTVARIWQAAGRLGMADVFVDRVGPGIIDDHVPLIDAGLPVADVVDCCAARYPAWHTTSDTPDKVSSEALRRAGMVALALLEDAS